MIVAFYRVTMQALKALCFSAFSWRLPNRGTPAFFTISTYVLPLQLQSKTGTLKTSQALVSDFAAASASKHFLYAVP